MTLWEAMKYSLTKLKSGRAEVGLFASKKARRWDNLSNPGLGFIHEFGYAKKKIPERSFLRMPLMTRLFPEAKKVDWIDLIIRKGVPYTLGILGALAVGVIRKAFATGGWGFWRKLRPRTIAAKGHATILIESGQMEKAIDSRVVMP